MSTKEGLMTHIWGPSFWHSLHCVSFNYPVLPTETDKQNYKIFFQSLSNVLPCCDCRDHYTEHIKEDNLKLCDAVFKSRDTLTKWLYDFHMCVNESLGTTYDLSYEKIKEIYTSYISPCSFSKELQQKAFYNYYNKEAPFITYDNAKQFSNYARKRNIKDFDFYIDKYNLVDHNSKDWMKRNSKCWKIIKLIRLNGYDNVECDGKYKGYPTIYQLYLIMLLCTTIKKENLNIIIGNMSI
jgi:hypothetical protein